MRTFDRVRFTRLAHPIFLGAGLTVAFAAAAQPAPAAPTAVARCRAGDIASCRVVLMSGDKAAQAEARKAIAEESAKSCDGGTLGACLRASMQFDALGTPEGSARALAIRTKACERGDTASCMAHAKSQPPSAESFAMYDTACKSGDGEACESAAEMVDSGSGVPKNPAAAKLLYVRACNEKVASSCKKLGLDGKACEAGDTELCAPACKKGHAASCKVVCEGGDEHACNDLCRKGDEEACEKASSTVRELELPRIAESKFRGFIARCPIDRAAIQKLKLDIEAANRRGADDKLEALSAKLEEMHEACSR